MVTGTTRSHLTWQFLLEKTHTMDRVGKLRQTGGRKDGFKWVSYRLGTQNFSTQHNA